MSQYPPGYADYARHFYENQPDSLELLAERLMRGETGIDKEFIALIRATALYRRDDLTRTLPALDSLLRRTAGTHPLLRGIAFRLRSVVKNTLGDHDQALTDANSGLNLLHGVDHKEEQIALWVVRAEAQIGANDLQDALKSLTTAQQMADSVHSLRGQSMVRLNLGNLKYKQERYREAFSDFEQALRLATDGGQVRIAQAALGNIAGVATMLNDPEQAIRLYDELLLKLGNRSPELRARIHGQIGYMHLEAGESDKAITSCLRAIQIADSIGDLRNAADARHDLAYAHWNLDHPEIALEQLEKVLHEYRNIGWREREQSAHYDLFSLLKELGNYKLAAEHLQRYTEISDSLVQARFNDQLARS